MNRYPNRSRRASDTAGHHIVHTQSPADLADVGISLPIGNRGTAGDDEQLTQPGERDDDILYEAVAEIVLIRITVEVPEWEYGDRWQRPGCRGPDYGGTPPWRIQRICLHRPIKILEPHEPKIARRSGKRSPYQIINRFRKNDATGLGVCLKTRCHIDAGAVDIVRCFDDFAEMQSHAQGNRWATPGV